MLKYILNPTEDPALPAHAESLCSALGDTTIEDICEACPETTVFVMASAEDKTLKQYQRDIFYREMFYPITHVQIQGTAKVEVTAVQNSTYTVNQFGYVIVTSGSVSVKYSPSHSAPLTPAGTAGVGQMYDPTTGSIIAAGPPGNSGIVATRTVVTGNRELFTDGALFDDDPYAPYCDGNFLGYYERVGYPTMIQSDLTNSGTNRDKVLSEVVADWSSEPEAQPSVVKCQTAAGPSPDPSCAIWKQATPTAGFQATCLSDLTDAQHAAENSRRGRQPKFQMFRRGKWLAFRLTVGPGEKTQNTGGDITFSQIEPRIRRAGAGR